MDVLHKHGIKVLLWATSIVNVDSSNYNDAFKILCNVCSVITTVGPH